MQLSSLQLQQLADQVKQWALELGFQQAGITDTDLSHEEEKYQQWIDQGYAGEMEYMWSHGTKRLRPAELVPGTLRIISVRMDYLPTDTQLTEQLRDPQAAYISRYALGRDYHKVLRKRLQQLAQKIATEIGPFGYRAFVDSAPVLERPIAEKAGLGWVGKNTLILNRQAGSFFFLGELFVDIPLPIDSATQKNHCGKCSSCLDKCPTDAFVGAGVLDARKCISYLTIELKGSIPVELRPLIGNRVYGCDDCQLVCPWNRFAKPSNEADFSPRHQLATASLVELFLWDEETFLAKTEGSPIRRIGYQRWLRNLAVGLGNAPSTIPVLEALKRRQQDPSSMVQEHVLWALAQHAAATKPTLSNE